MILSGDIGGTHTRLGLFSSNGELTPVAEKKSLNKGASGVEQIIESFLAEYQKGAKIIAGCLAVAGIVREGRCHLTNLNWHIDAAHISKKFAIPSFSLVNDLEAHAHGLSLVQPKDLVVLQPGIKKAGNQVLVFCGTGLGEAVVYWDGKQLRPIAGEGGHADFAPRDELEVELFLYLKRKFGHVSVERVLSGAGLYEIYQFLIESKKGVALETTTQAMKQKNPSFVIVELGQSQGDRVCSQALDLFLSIYGAEAGNMALKVLPFGGVYIGGGMVSHLASKVQKSQFLSSFSDKGRFKDLLLSIPVSIVLAENAALLGAAKVAKEKLS